MEKIVLLLAKELNIKPAQAEAALQLLDDGNTVPFIARCTCAIWTHAGRKF